ncbi:hypothetical protein B0T20DRAFT_347109 [Sordaria brevicollis]|uniref:Transmembrane protein n=1 Tax=Sordaria brevicollis TaxID=83679 RepID=A0AAE0PL96_SORBR|nr:hypothetical protein B0T20DRAFT_347109 [Sordaria brevicollis]
MDQPSPSPKTPLLASQSNPKKPVLDGRVFHPPSPSSDSSGSGDYLAPGDSDSDDDDNNSSNQKCGIQISMVLFARILLFVLTLANLITWIAMGRERLDRNRFVVLNFIELVFMLITNGGFIFKLVREKGRDGGLGLSIMIPRISLAIGEWSCGFGAGKKWLNRDADKEAKTVRDVLRRLLEVLVEVYLGVTLIVFTKCAFHTARWWQSDYWKAPLVIGYVVGTFQLLVVILNHSKVLGQKTTIEIAYHGDGPARSGRRIQLPVDAETVTAPVSITA